MKMQIRLWNILQLYCKDYIDTLSHCKKGYFLYRGYQYPIANIKLFKHKLSNRAPLHTPRKVHDEINNFYLPLFGWKIRNGAFCYGMNALENIPYDLGYGTNFLFFPTGSFEYAYDPNIFDLYAKVACENFETIKLNYSSENFCNALAPHLDGDGFGVEISIKTEKYLLINIKYTDFIISKIWT